MFAKVMFAIVPQADFKPSLIVSVFVFELVNEKVEPSIVIEYLVDVTPCNTE